MSAVVLQGLLSYLQATLSVDNRQWLAAHLVEPVENAKPYTKEELIARVEEAEADIAAGRFYTEEEVEKEVDKIMEGWREAEAA